jgi:hypothetical protein
MKFNIAKFVILRTTNQISKFVHIIKNKNSISQNL